VVFGAVLVVAAVGALFLLFAAPALFALGVFNPSTYTGRAATGFGELGMPADWSYSGTTLIIFIRNGSGQDITITGVESPSCTAYSGQQTIRSGEPYGETYEVTLMNCAAKTPGSAYSQTVTITYTQQTGLTHVATGTLTGTVS
jgi:hypothetical protein